MSNIDAQLGYKKYAFFISLLQIQGFRHYANAEIKFEFPVTALIGQNGSGKSSILHLVYTIFNPQKIKKIISLNSIDKGSIDKSRIQFTYLMNETEIRGTLFFRNSRALIDPDTTKESGNVFFFDINRTIPKTESPLFPKKRLLKKRNQTITFKTLDKYREVLDIAGNILKKDLSNCHVKEVCVSRKYRQRIKNDDITHMKKKYKFTSKTTTYPSFNIIVNSDGGAEYTQQSFGAGESWLIELLISLKDVPEKSIILIDELENGLHINATTNLIDHFKQLSASKSLQFIFTTHSHEIISRLPDNAIWTCGRNGVIRQGKLDHTQKKQLNSTPKSKSFIIIVEDNFATKWVKYLLSKDYIASKDIHIKEIGSGEELIKFHILFNRINFDIKLISIVDGDKRSNLENAIKKETKSKNQNIDGIFSLPGNQPEYYLYSFLKDNISDFCDELCQNIEDSNIPNHKKDIENYFSSTQILPNNRHECINNFIEYFGWNEYKNEIIDSIFSYWIKNQKEEYERIKNEIIKFIEK